MSSKIAKGSAVILLGAFIFRIGGLIYRAVMARLLDPVGYGILGLTLPFQGFLIIIAGAGLPPAIAKHVSQYYAIDDTEMVKAIINVSTKMMIVFGLIFSVVIFIFAEPLAIGLFHKPEAVLPFQLIALITPFSVIVGAMRGTFQGFYQMTNILITRGFELFFMIVVAVALVLSGFYVAGAVIGTAVGFMMALVSAVYLYRRDVWILLNNPRKLLQRNTSKKFTFFEEMQIAKMLLFFSIPVVITGLAELLLYDMGTLVVGIYMPSQFVGYYTAASPVARLPLIISMAVATSVLPATSEAMSLNDSQLLKTYILQSYRYVSLVVLPICVGTIVFATPIMTLINGSAYAPGSEALQILAVGMLFFTIYTISSSISQGLGKPTLPMMVLIGGTTIDLIFSVLLIPPFGINGAAVATTIASFFIMSVLAYKTLQLARVSLPLGEFGKIAIASILMGVIFIFFPNNYLSLFIAIILAPFIYGVILAVIGGLTMEDIRIMHKLSTKLGPFSIIFDRIVGLLERFAV